MYIAVYDITKHNLLTAGKAFRFIDIDSYQYYDKRGSVICFAQ